MWNEAIAAIGGSLFIVFGVARKRERNELITKVDLAKLQSTGNFDLMRAKEGGLDVQVFSIWCGGEYGKGTAFKFANREIDSLDALIKRNPDKIVLVRNAAELEKAVAQ